MSRSKPISQNLNPVKVARTSKGLTLAQASEQADVHLQAFFLQEKGVYPVILPSIMEWLGPDDEECVVEEYRSYQRTKRRQAGDLFGLAQYTITEPTDKNPLVQFRLELPMSRMGFAKGFCVHPGLLYRVETGISQRMPDQLEVALEEAQLPMEAIKELDYRIGESCRVS